MASAEQAPFTGAQDPAQIGAFIHDLLTAGVRLGLAVVAGLIAARLIRARGVHWAWPAALGCGALLRVGSLHGLALPLACAGMVAARRARRWHLHDLDAGGDLARAAQARRAPWETLAGLARRARPVTARRVPGELTLGRGEDGRAVTLPLGGLAGSHTLVVGATGSGKTVTQSLMALAAIERGMGVIVVDPKGDRSMRGTLQHAARSQGREFLEWTPAGPAVYNPYGRGGETEIADRLLAGERFTEPHYLRQAQRYLGHVVRALRSDGTEVTLDGIVRLLDPPALEELLRRLPGTEAEPSHDYLDSLTARQLRDLAGVRDRLAILTESDVGRWLDPSRDHGPRIELMTAARSGAVVYFALESDSRPLLAQMLGAAVVQDLQSTIGALQGDPAPTLVVIDEFSAVAAEQVVALFGRARSAGFSLVLGTQELSDLRLPGRERLLEQILGNLSVLLAHRQVVPASAELIAAMGGARGSWRVSFADGGRRTRTRVKERLLAAEELMSLQPGSCVLLPLGAGGAARRVQVLAPERGL